jgi:Ca-activated chloride channel homolog
MNQEQEQRLHEMLCAYVLGEASDSERAEIERELMRSPELRAERERVERTIGLVQSALSENESLSPGAAATVRSAASGVPVSNATRRGWSAIPWMPIAAGLGAVALGALILHESVQRGTVVDTSVARVDAPALPGTEWKERAEKERYKVKSRAEVAPAAVPATKSEELARLSNSKDASTNLGVPEVPDRKQLPADADQSVDLVEAVGKYEGGEATDVDVLRKGLDALAKAPAEQPVAQSMAPVAAAKMQASAHSEVRLSESTSAGRQANPSGNEFYLGQGAEVRKVGAAPSAGTAGLEQVTAPGEKPAEFLALRSVAVDRGTSLVPSSTSGSGPSTPAPMGPSTGGPSNGATRYAARPAVGAVVAPGSPAPLVSSGGGGGGNAPATKKSEMQAGKPALQLADSLEAKGDRGDGRVALGFVGESKNKAGDDTHLQRLGYVDEDAPNAARRQHDDEQRLYYWQCPPEVQQQYLDRECRRILDNCVRRPNERPRDMFFRFWGDNPFEVAALDPLSTFGVDVDTASYTLARRFLNEGNLPEKAQIRTEEFVNYFKSDVASPAQGPFAIHTDLTPSRFSTDTTRSMLRVVVRGKDIAKVDRKRLNLTFVVDVSGSMREQNRLEMVKHAMRLLVSQLDQYDRIAIVKFSTDAQRVLPLTSAANRADIESAINPLQPEGSTNSDAGLKLGYAIALGGLDMEAINRVVFLSDGVANVGETDPIKISESVKPMREKGIYLNTIGVGMSNHNDVLLEQLADKADGVCNYIDSPDEAKRALVDNFTGAFQPIARDVKIQVEFDPAQVLRYRLLGYENRAIADADFRNDKVDAGEIGAGTQVTALYELERQGAASSEKPLATVRLRWKEPRNFGTNPEQDAATEIAVPVSAAQMTNFEGAGQGYRKAVLAAQFAEILRRSIHARGDSLDDLLNESLKLQKEIPNDKDFTEFVLLVSKAKDLILRTMPACDDLCQAIDAVRENQYRHAQLEQLQHEQDAKVLEELRRQNDEMESRLRDVIRRHLEREGR